MAVMRPEDSKQTPSPLPVLWETHGCWAEKAGHVASPPRLGLHPCKPAMPVLANHVKPTSLNFFWRQLQLFFRVLGENTCAGTRPIQDASSTLVSFLSCLECCSLGRSSSESLRGRGWTSEKWPVSLLRGMGTPRRQMAAGHTRSLSRAPLLS